MRSVCKVWKMVIPSSCKSLNELLYNVSIRGNIKLLEYLRYSTLKTQVLIVEIEINLRYSTNKVAQFLKDLLLANNFLLSNGRKRIIVDYLKLLSISLLLSNLKIR